MKRQARWTITAGPGPLVATAVHDGHDVRPEVAEGLALTDAQRLREEDPFTGGWTAVADTRIVVHRSRFEMDLNRPREGAVYVRPEDAWGLNVWREQPAEALIERSRAQYDDFYREVRELFADMEARHGRFVVLDIHTYNHRREGADGPLADPTANPQVNIGTGTMDRAHWGRLPDRFIEDLASADFMGSHLDVRENVKFRGGAFPRWIHETFPHSACALAVEFKKTFMDEWSGQPDTAAVEAIRVALASTTPGILEELSRL